MRGLLFSPPLYKPETIRSKTRQSHDRAYKTVGNFYNSKIVANTTKCSIDKDRLDLGNENNHQFSFIRPKTKSSVPEWKIEGRPLFNIINHTPQEGYTYDPDVIRARKSNTTRVNITKTIQQKPLHKDMPLLTTDTLKIDKPRDPGVNVLLGFDQKIGREDNMMYKQTERHKNIIKENHNSGAKSVC